MPDVALPLTFSGNEITDAVRVASATWGTGVSGGMADGQVIPGGVGIRRAATNLFRHGQCDVSTDYNQRAGGEVLSVDATKPAPFSPQSIKVVTNSAGPNQGTTIIGGSSLSAAPGVNGVAGIWFSGVAGSSYRFFPRWQNSDATATLGPVTIFTATGAWQWLAFPGPAVVAAGKTGIDVRLSVDVNGTRTETFWVAHGMLESGQSVVAPYVATSGGATATHAAGRVQASATLLNATQGWAALRVRMGVSSAVADPLVATFWAWFAAGNPVIDLRYSGGALRARRRTDAGASTEAAPALSWAAGDVLTVVMAWTAAGVSISVNGSAFTTVAGAYATTTLPSTIDIGSLGAPGTRQIDSDVLWFSCGTGVLVDADAAAIHAALVAGRAPRHVGDFPSWWMP